jgi:sec-independent protein translocase protein TatA
MGSFGISEIILILIIGFIVLGPDKLPKFLRSIGRAFGELSSVKKDFEDIINEAKDSVNDTLKSEVKTETIKNENKPETDIDVKEDSNQNKNENNKGE